MSKTFSVFPEFILRCVCRIQNWKPANSSSRRRFEASSFAFAYRIKGPLLLLVIIAGLKSALPLHYRKIRLSRTIKYMDKGPQSSILNISGAYGEGGGQIIRNAATLAVLLRRHVNLTEIRANRPNPGLAAQHLHSITALTQLSGATAINLRKQATNFTLDASKCSPPSDQPGITTAIDLVTAGSTTLAMQCILPYLMGLKSPSEVTIIGGTHVMKAPSFDFFKDVFVPTINLIHGKEIVTAKLGRPGYFPRGGGDITVSVYPSSGNSFPHFTLKEFSVRKPYKSILHITPNNNIPYDIPKDTEIRRNQNLTAYEVISHSKPPYGFSYVSEGRKPPSLQELEQNISNVTKELRKFEQTESSIPIPIDYHMQDQLIIYMTLAKISEPSGSSSIRTMGPLTDHTLSAIYTAELFCVPHKFTITKVNDSDEVFDISI